MSSSGLGVVQPLENEEFKKLLDYKVELVSQVSKVDLINFSEELYKLVVIPKEARDAFASLDHHNLNSKLRVRYLLKYVFEGVKHDATVFHRFLKVLAGLGASVDRVFRCLSMSSSVFERWAGVEGLASDEPVSSKAVVDDICLSEDDVPFLMETLVEVCNKWEEIGLSLGLPRKTSSECRGSSNAVSLTNILYEWISYHPKQTLFKKLKLALCRPLVGRSSFALTFEERFREAKRTNIVTVAKKRALGSDDQASLEAGSEAEFGAKQSQEFDQICLSEGDVSILLELVAEFAYKWNLIGTSLGLPVSLMKELEAKSDADLLCLRDILLEWLTGKHRSARRPTLNNLTLTLGSQLVSLPITACHLKRRFRQAIRQHILSVTVIPVAKRPHLSSMLEVVYQSGDTAVADGKSALMEVQVLPNEFVSYQWLKDSLCLSDNLSYSGACSSMLVIRHVTQGMQGDYTCRVRNGSEEVVCKVCTLTVIFPRVKQHLISVYEKQRVISLDTWPPVGISTALNLALIKKNQCSDDYNYSVRGDMDDILLSNEKADYEEVFEMFESGALVLVEGRPGSGKTTLINKLTKDWATNGKVLKNTKMLFPIPLGSLADKRDETLSDVLELFYWDEEEREDVLGKIEKSHGEGVCFIIDGLDECQPQHERNSVIYELVQKTYLPAAMVIVASRPVATATLRHGAPVTRQIEVLGFTQNQVFEYIEMYHFKKHSTSFNLSVYLHSHVNILYLCYLPLHAAMICFLYERQKNDMPLTETEIYYQFTRSIVLRKLRSSDSSVRLYSLDDIGGEEQDYFSKICHLAFDMTITSRHVVYQRDTEVQLSRGTGPDDAPSLGLVTVDSKAGLYGLDISYAFLHSTFQEYLAALHIAKLEDEQQMQIIQSYADDGQMCVMWKFYCGIVKFDHRAAQLEQIMRYANTLHRVQYAFESQQTVVCDKVPEFREVSLLDINNCILTPADLTAVGYVISSTSLPVSKLSIRSCDLHDDHVGAFLREVKNSKLKFIQELDLANDNIGADGAIALADRLESCSNLQTLNLSSNYVGADGTAALAEGLKSCTKLQTLHLSDNKIGDDGAVALADTLWCYKNLQMLNLSDNTIGDHGAAALADQLKSCTYLHTLNLSDNTIGDHGAAALADQLKYCTYLHTLNLSDNNIGDHGVASLSNLKFCIPHD